MSNYCAIDFNSKNMMCKDNNDVIGKYSDNVKSINDVIPCTSAPSVNDNTWNCTDRGSCNMGDGSYKKWINNQTNLRRD